MHFGPILIRRGVLEDRPAVQSIALESMKQFGLTADFHGLDVELGIFGSGSSSVFLELVAEMCGQVVGSVILAEEGMRTLKLCGFYVKTCFRGCGVGRSLLFSAVNQSKKYGYNGIFLGTCSNMHSALHLYHSFGWSRIGRSDPKSGTEWRYFLRLPISGSSDARSSEERNYAYEFRPQAIAAKI